MGSLLPSLAKTATPRAEGVFARKRLFDLIDRSPQKNIIWVTAPAGAGKTTLVASYLESRKLPSLWYQVDEGDEDIASFFYYLGLAVQAACGNPQHMMPLLTPEYRDGVTTFARRYFQELYSLVPRPFALVFDNYQLTSPYALLHSVIKEACDQMPEGVELIVISRQEPAPLLATAESMARAQLLTWNDIRFSFDELCEMVRAQGWKNLDEQTLLQLYARTEGWVSGLQLMLENLKNNGVDFREVKGLGSNDIFNYFAGELFRNMDKETRMFLVQTSILPELNISVTVKLTGLRSAEQILNRLHRNHFFTGRHSGAIPVYQYHPLFKEFLQSRLREIFNNEEILALRLKAAGLLEEIERTDDAAQLFIEATDWRSLTRLILRSARTMAEQGRNQTMHDWIRAMPVAALDATPWLWYWKGVSLMLTDAPESQRCFEKAYGQFSSRDDREGVFIAWAGIADINIWVGEFSPLDDWIDKLDAVLKRDASFPSPAIEERITLSLFNALSIRQPDRPDIELWSDKVFNLLYQKTNVDSSLLLSGVYLGIYYLWMGNFAKASLVSDLLTKAAHLPDVPEINRLSVNTLNTTAALFLGRPEQCLDNMREALQLAESSGIHVWNNHLYLHGMNAAVALGDEKLYRELERKLDLREGRRFDIAYSTVLSAWQAYLHGDHDFAATRQKVACDTLESVGFILAMPLAESIMAEVLYAAGEREKAIHAVASALARGQSIGSVLCEYWCRLLQAHMALDGGNKQEGLDFLRTALVLGRKHAFETVSIWAPSFLPELCAQALAHDIETEYVQRLIRERKLVPAGTSVSLERWPYPLKIYALGKFTVQKDGELLGAQGKSRFKLIELLRVIVAFGGEQVNGYSLADILWPDAEGDAAESSLGSSIHRLRKLLGSDSSIVVHDGKISLNREYCWLDVWAFGQLEAKMETMLHDEQAITPFDLGSLGDELFCLYRGVFLADADGESWVVPLRETLKGKFVRLVISCGKAWETLENFERAADCYQRGVDLEPFSEELYRNLISCHLKLGYPSEAVKTFNRCSSLFASCLGVAPSAETRALVSEYLGVEN